MEGLDLTNPLVWMSVVCIAALCAAASFAYQKYQGQETIKTNAIVRDGLLGLIFSAMAWNFIPESMTSITNSVGTITNTTTETVSKQIGGSLSLPVKMSTDIDVQFGPAKF